MFKIRRAEERGQADHGWLKSFHTFSFADYFDSNFMGFRSLRVINEDRVEPGTGFGTHSHKDMEIFTYVIEGSLAHKDSLGIGSILKPGDVQIMSAGTGVSHSEFNSSAIEKVHFLQIWMLPDQVNLKPRYSEKHFPSELKLNQLKLLGSKSGRDESIVIHQNIDLYASVLDPATKLEYKVPKGNCAWVQIVKGSIDVSGTMLKAGDGVALENEDKLEFVAHSHSEFLLFDIGN